MPDRIFHWSALAGLSLALLAAFQAAGLPAALMLGPMVAGIILAVLGIRLDVPPPAFLAAKSALGVLIAAGLPTSLWADLSRHWFLFLGGTLWAMGASVLLGLALTRRKILPGSTPIWGLSPGGAGVMIIMSEQYGADMRLTAFMQYLRVLGVALAATLVSGLWTGGPGAERPETIWLPALNGPEFGKTLGVIALGAFLTVRTRFSSGAILYPLALGFILKQFGWLNPELPPWFMAPVYALIGWSVGLRFTRPLLAYAARALPAVLTAIVALIALCGLFAVILTVWAEVDPLTAYLATSPGGLDTVAVIAASTGADLPFIMAMQAIRMLLVIVTGPYLARLAVRLSAAGPRPK